MWWQADGVQMGQQGSSLARHRLVPLPLLFPNTQIRTTGRDYQQRGLVATVATAWPNQTAHQRFLPTGPLALLPVRGGFSSVVWSCPPEVRPRPALSCFCLHCAARQQSDSQLGAPSNARLANAAAWRPAVQMAARLEALPRHELAAAITDALTSGPNYPPRPPLGELLGGVLAPARSSRFVEPPAVTDVVGDAPKSFPLMLQHAGKRSLQGRKGGATGACADRSAVPLSMPP